MARSLLDIRIGTMVRAGVANPADYVRQILPLGFESIQPFFWQTIGQVDIKRLAGEIREAIGDADVVVNSLGMFGNPLEGGDLDRQSLAGWETLIDNAHLFGAKIIGGSPGTCGASRSRKKSSTVSRSLGPARQTRRGQGRAHRIRKLRDGRQLEVGRLEHRAYARRLGADVQRSSLRRSRAGMGALSPARLPDRARSANSQMGEQDLHVHGKDATVRWDVVREHGTVRQASVRADALARFRRQQLDADHLRLAHFTGAIDIEGWHDPVYREELEMTGQVRALNYLKDCRGGPRPIDDPN